MGEIRRIPRAFASSAITGSGATSAAQASQRRAQSIAIGVGYLVNIRRKLTERKSQLTKSVQTSQLFTSENQVKLKFFDMA